MKPSTENLKLPHFFLFKDLYYSHLEAKKILKDIEEGQESFDASRVEAMSKHYLVLFEVLEFLHEYTPDFFVINKINDTASEIVCFANEEFSKAFGLKTDPEGKDIFNLLAPREERALREFIDSEIEGAKWKMHESGQKSMDVSIKSDSVELPIIHSGRYPTRLFEVHVRLTGAVRDLDGDTVFEGYSIILARDVTETVTQKQVAESFTNIPEIIEQKFYSEAYKRRVLNEHPRTLTLKNTHVLTGFSDISNSAQLRLEATTLDHDQESHENVKELNKKIEQINHFLHDIWAEAKVRIQEIHPAVFLLEETDGLDYTVCFVDKNSQVEPEVFERLREEEILILAESARACAVADYPLKHIAVAHDKKVDFYFEEKFENRFKVETHSVDLFIKKKRLEKAHEKGTEKRITEEKMVTVAVDNNADFEFYIKLFESFKKRGIIEHVEQGEVEELSGLEQVHFIRGKVVEQEESFFS